MMERLGIFWDVDGTLSNSYELGHSSTNAVLARHNKTPISEEEYHEGTKFTTPRRLAWHVTGNPDDIIGEKLGKDFDDLYIELVSTKTAPLYDGIENLLKDIRGKFNNVEYAALSNACGGYVRAVLGVNGLSDMFSLALGADDVPAAKPQPDGLNQIVETLKLDRNRCIYVGDSPTDGQAATAADMVSIGVTWGSHAVEKVTANFTYTVHSVDDLHNILQQLLQNLVTRS